MNIHPSFRHYFFAKNIINIFFLILLCYHLLRPLHLSPSTLYVFKFYFISFPYDSQLIFAPRTLTYSISFLLGPHIIRATFQLICESISRDKCYTVLRCCGLALVNFSFFTWTGVIPRNFVNALLKLSGLLYPYFRAISITFSFLDDKSVPASDNLLLRIYSPIE